jgi:predicted O-methyltransferase YrrM
MAIFDRFRKRAAPAPVPSPQPSATLPAPALGQPANRRLFESQSLDGEITVSRAEHDLLQQHFAAARARFPGPVYLEWLQFFHRFVEPRNYLEIGVETGASLAFAQPLALAVGIDPLLEIKHELKARHKLYSQTSDEFFTTQDVAAVFEGEAIALAFIDGMHTFDQALKDFIHVERHAARESIVLFHDVFPLNLDSSVTR